ncbi:MULTISPECIES: TetR/AcrR family transcriptional regulator [Paenibacillus]|uniref:TetR/AcrR family transcriptional regulator n=1 Tax=Paenibacillus TaxID=44249 RepID=UPI0007BFADEF|nr:MULTISPECIES: TetR/AcrR family transcriptional regulator [Paenibacillus]MCZ1267020.1 TetR/AcrR family transcriptional regulator [Paenibacillus tundrae]SDJ98192.1 transcriptional regulator, TetR family [Paenibacillus sp. OK060]SEA28817.1 transcriptional regulator, TetR family [Paenibacillus sp. 276b]SHN53575.1 transcriptional regulator, TetR family [Paenibacillus sp. ov031]SLJ97193.1 transcriptional regulator, TetR family [Paenibacillus sp. RU5A]
MARNKHPEQTVQQILNVAAQLFTDKGFEKTSIQDIIVTLGMSKGAVYHHFRSKEEILEAVMEQQFNYTAQMLDHLVTNTTTTPARDKLVQILEHVVSDQQAHSLDRVLRAQIKNPVFIVRGIQQAVRIDAPVIAAILREGITDGSIHTEDPEACAEVFMMLVNIWINPTLFDRNSTETKQRLYFLQRLMNMLGADIVSESLIERILDQHAAMGAYPILDEEDDRNEG